MNKRRRWKSKARRKERKKRQIWFNRLDAFTKSVRAARDVVTRMPFISTKENKSDYWTYLEGVTIANPKIRKSPTP